MTRDAEIKVVELNRLLHDLKLPITIMQALSDILHKNNQQKELEEYLLMLDRNIRYMTRISNSMKDTILKIDDENEKVFENDIVGYTEAMIEAVTPVCEIRNIKLTFECEQEYVECNLNWRQYERILLNVLQNSIKHAKKCTKIKVILNITNEKIEVKIYDDGKNCDDTDTLNIPENSSGEGLFIITTLAKKMNASVDHRIDCYGMKFVLEIPNNDENRVIKQLEI